MPIDFSLLQGQKPGGVVAQLPTTASPLDTLAGGLMKGAETASNIAANNQQIAASKQTMSQNAQLFPSALAKSNADASSAQSDASIKGIAAKTAQQKYDELQQQKAAFNQSFNQGMAMMMKTDPASGLTMQKQMADTKLALGQAANQMASGQAQALKNYTGMVSTAAQLAAQAGQAEQQKPGSGQQVWSQGLKLLPDSISSLLPQQYNAATNMTMVKLGHDALMDAQQQQILKNATPSDKNAIRMSDLITKQAQGQTTPAEDKELEILANNNKSKNNPFDQANAKQQATQNTAVDTQNQQLQVVSDDVKDARTLLQSIPAGYTGPIVDYLKANARSSDIQKLQKLLAGIPIAVKAMYGVTPGNRLTATELQQLNKASGSTAINKDALQYVLDRLGPQIGGIMHKNWEVQNSNYKNGSPDVYKNWLASHPEPEDPFNKSKPSTTSSSTAPAQFQEGKIYQDSNGNKAKYTNGKWEPV